MTLIDAFGIGAMIALSTLIILRSIYMTAAEILSQLRTARTQLNKAKAEIIAKIDGFVTDGHIPAGIAEELSTEITGLAVTTQELDDLTPDEETPVE
jgi:hypothetical protein